MAKEKIEEIIVGLFKEKPILNEISPDQDFFDFGASSLTIVDLQIQIEEALKIEVPTSKLMSNPTIQGWISAYSETAA